MILCLFFVPCLVCFVAWLASERRRNLGLPSSRLLLLTSVASFATSIALAVALVP